jgi:hypothetical protein
MDDGDRDGAKADLRRQHSMLTSKREALSEQCIQLEPWIPAFRVEKPTSD